MSPTRRRLLPPGAVLAAAACALMLAACGGDGRATATATAPATAPAPTAPPAPAPAPAPPATTPAPPAATTPAPAALPPAPQCDAGAANCSAASGRVITLESVDADGDGDLHLVLASRAGITLPGVTVLDINKDLRPAVDPRPGDWAAGAGPVYRGSYGQRQIQVERVAFSPTRTTP